MKKKQLEKKLEKQSEPVQESVVSHRIPMSIFLIGIVLGIGVLGVAAGGLALESYVASERIFPGVMIGMLDVGGLTREQAQHLLEKRISELNSKGITVVAQSKKEIIPLEEVATDPDIPSEALSQIFILDGQKTVEQAFSRGRGQGIFFDYLNRVATLFHKKNSELIATFDANAFEKSLRKAFPELTTEPRGAYFDYSSKEKKVRIQKEENGKDINVQKALKESSHSLMVLQSPTSTLSFVEKKAFPTSNDLARLLPDAERFFERPPVTLTLDTNHWVLAPEKTIQWLSFDVHNGASRLVFDKNKIEEYLKKEIEPKVSIEAKDSRFEIKDGKVTILQMGQKGRKLLIDKTAQALIDDFMDTQAPSVSLVMQDINTEVATPEDLPDVKEIVAEAVTDFRGSPKNRKFNIALGAKKVHGALLKPDEAFSLISYLGPIDEQSGFLPELVIKGDRTKPEYGGGLCQLSTTIFRAVSQAGLPILERRNHSYRVSYYEPPIGYDATIYFPKPDFRFKNDTGSTILIQSAIQGTKLKIILWGTKDSRIVEIDPPIVFNRKKPTQEKILETPDLKPGEKKCLEKAHEGADAVFERRVKLASGEVRKDTFKSHYVAWPALCLVGKKVESSQKDDSVSELVPPQENPIQGEQQQNSQSKPQEQTQQPEQGLSPVPVTTATEPPINPEP